MRFQNGYGSITKLTGKRRKPWMVRVSNGMEYDEKIHDFKPKRVVLGYYATRKEANIALAEYNSSPYDLDKHSLTFAEAFELYKKTNAYKKLGKSSISSKRAAFNHCAALHDKKIRDITYNMLQNVIDNCGLSYSTLTNIKIVMNSAFEEAAKLNIISKNPVQYVEFERTEPTIERKVITEEEIRKLFDMSDNWDAKVMLILLHTGLRANELLKNCRSNVNLNERWIYVPEGLAKNNESIRYVPIHDAIYEHVEYFYNISEQYDTEKLVIQPDGEPVTYPYFRYNCLPDINKALGVEHTLHDTRHSFASYAYRYNLEELTIQKIVGHKPSSILHNIYTHITPQELLAAVNQIRFT